MGGWSSAGQVPETVAGAKIPPVIKKRRRLRPKTRAESNQRPTRWLLVLLHPKCPPHHHGPPPALCLLLQSAHCSRLGDQALLGLVYKRRQYCTTVTWCRQQGPHTLQWTGGQNCQLAFFEGSLMRTILTKESNFWGPLPSIFSFNNAWACFVPGWSLWPAKAMEVLCRHLQLVARKYLQPALHSTAVRVEVEVAEWFQWNDS